MLLYYMTSANVAFDHILPERRMKLSEFHELNDPFELLSASLTDKQVRKLTRLLQAHWTKTKGVICFSDNFRSPVMWAHYADKHYGVCLVFEVPTDKDLIHPMDYTGKRLEYALDTLHANEATKLEFIKASLHTKANDWAYEREWRAMADLNEREGPKNFAYVDFNDNLVLREVILGCRCKLSVGAVAKRVGRPVKDVIVYRARPMFGEFKMTRNKAVKAINVRAAK